MQNFFTFFDSYYLIRGLALYRSLKQQCPEFRLWIVCYDEHCYDVLARLNYPEIHLVREADFEMGDADLLKAKQERSRVEYFFTNTPSLFLYLFNKHPDIETLTYVDADVYFFADPALMFEAMPGYSIAITPHRFPDRYRHLEKFGIYNTGFASFRNDEHGRACLQWWRERSIEWCFDREEDGRYAGQKYADVFPEMFEGVYVIQHPGVNLAPWNLGNYRIHLRNGLVWVDDVRLVFYHYHGLKQIRQWLFNNNISKFHVRPNSAVRKAIYGPYIEALRLIESELAPLSSQSHIGRGHRLVVYQGSVFKAMIKLAKGTAHFFLDAIRGGYLFLYQGHVI